MRRDGEESEGRGPKLLRTDAPRAMVDEGAMAAFTEEIEREPAMGNGETAWRA